MESYKEKFNNFISTSKAKAFVGVSTGALLLSTGGGSAFASTGESVDVSGIIKGVQDDLMKASTPIITGALAIGAAFFSAKFLWGKFKSMAK